MTDIRTWQQAVDYTFQTRHSWRHGTGRKTSAINCNHFTRLRGTSFPITSINQPIITTVGIELEDEGKSDATINRVVSAVSTVLNHLAFDGIIEQAPRFRRRKEGEGRALFYTKPEVEQMYDAALTVFHRQDIADITLIAAYCGARRGELLKLKRRDIDFGLNTIHIGGLPDVRTKAANYRAVPIHDRIHNLLDEKCSQLASSDLVFGRDWTSGDQLLRSFNKVRKFINKDEAYVFHSLRHSFGTWCAEAAVPIRTIMSLMGHKRIETTLRYAKTTDRARTEAIARI